MVITNATASPDVAAASLTVARVPRYRFDIAVDARDWTLYGYEYRVIVPILGPGTNRQLTTREELSRGCGGAEGSKRVFVVTHEGARGAVTCVRFDVPPEAVADAPSVCLRDAELTVSIEHLHDGWMRLARRLSVAGNDGDLQGWDSAWDELKVLTLEARSGQCQGAEQALVEHTTLPADVAARVSAEAVFSEAGWSKGACRMALFHTNRAVADGVPGAKAVLDRLLATSDLTTEDVRDMFENGLMITRTVAWQEVANDEWIVFEKKYRLWANRTVLDHFGIDPSSLTRFSSCDTQPFTIFKIIEGDVTFYGLTRDIPGHYPRTSPDITPGHPRDIPVTSP
jgi:hypothetical protein